MISRFLWNSGYGQHEASLALDWYFDVVYLLNSLRVSSCIEFLRGKVASRIDSPAGGINKKILSSVQLMGLDFTFFHALRGEFESEDGHS